MAATVLTATSVFRKGHHELSHHGGDKEKHEKSVASIAFTSSNLAYVLEKMQSVKEGERTLLDNSMVVYGAGISDGDRHNHDNLPILLAGKPVAPSRAHNTSATKTIRP
jgi:hypothetical protein